MGALYFRFGRTSSRRNRSRVVERLHRLGLSADPLYQPPHASMWRLYQVRGFELSAARKFLRSDRSVDYVTHRHDDIYFVDPRRG